MNEAEFRVAQKIQQSLFPTDAPELPDFDIAGASHPALSAGGDLYDYLPMPDGSLGIVVADASGHGVGPAMIMAETRAYLRAITQDDCDCGEALTLLNRFLCLDDAESGFVTCLFAKLDAAKRTFTYASAEQAGYFVDADGQTQQLDSHGPPLGLVDNASYETGPPTTLAVGSLLVLPTDGILEAQSAERELFGSKRMLAVLSDSRLRSSHDLIDALHRSVGEFSEWAPPKDDMTAVVVRAI